MKRSREAVERSLWRPSYTVRDDVVLFGSTIVARIRVRGGGFDVRDVAGARIGDAKPLQ